MVYIQQMQQKVYVLMENHVNKMIIIEKKMPNHQENVFNNVNMNIILIQQHLVNITVLEKKVVQQILKITKVFLHINLPMINQKNVYHNVQRHMFI